jgi:hypothetical protein
MVRRATERRAVALTVAAAVNGLLLCAFVWDLRVLPKYVEAPAVQAELVRVSPPERPAPASLRTAPAVPTRAPAFAAPRAPAAAMPAVVAPPAIVAPSPTPDDDLASLSKVMRAHLGCGVDQLAGLSEPARAACAQRLASEQRNAPEYLVDQDKRLVFDAAAERARWFQKPFLASDPKNGCKLKVTDNKSAAPSGQEYRAGIACELSF